MFNFPHIDSETTVWLLLDGQEYELSQFNITFGQSVDHKGQPQHEVRGGRMTVTMTQTIPDSIYKWAMTSCMKNGEVVFRSKTSNAPLKVEFMRAYCVNFDRLMVAGTGLQTSLVISPDEITLNGRNFDNHWVE